MMPFSLYCIIAKHFYLVRDLTSALYLILSWNLCCRTNNTENIKMSHIHWQNDSLKIDFAISKSNQDGERLEYKLIFANPENPVICPVLSLALSLVNSSKVYSESDRLFTSSNQADTFLKSLTKAMESPDVQLELVRLGLKKTDIGSHSIRKGAGTVNSELLILR